MLKSLLLAVCLTLAFLGLSGKGVIAAEIKLTIKIDAKDPRRRELNELAQSYTLEIFNKDDLSRHINRTAIKAVAKKLNKNWDITWNTDTAISDAYLCTTINTNVAINSTPPPSDRAWQPCVRIGYPNPTELSFDFAQPDDLFKEYRDFLEREIGAAKSHDDIDDILRHFEIYYKFQKPEVIGLRDLPTYTQLIKKMGKLSYVPNQSLLSLYFNGESGNAFSHDGYFDGKLFVEALKIENLNELSSDEKKIISDFFYTYIRSINPFILEEARYIDEGQIEGVYGEINSVIKAIHSVEQSENSPQPILTHGGNAWSEVPLLTVLVETCANFGQDQRQRRNKCFISTLSGLEPSDISHFSAAQKTALMSEYMRGYTIDNARSTAGTSCDTLSPNEFAGQKHLMDTMYKVTGCDGGNKNCVNNTYFGGFEKCKLKALEGNTQ